MNRSPTVSYFVSCGEEASDYRKQAYHAVDSATTVMRSLGTPIVTDTWNYQHQPGELLGRGELRRRSIDEVSGASLVIGIFCESVPLPSITMDELRKAVAVAKDDDEVSVYIFLKRPVSDSHKQFMAELDEIYDGSIGRSDFDDAVEFERKLAAALMTEFLQLHASMVNGAQ